jgi:hypothetical protein
VIESILRATQSCHHGTRILLVELRSIRLAHSFSFLFPRYMHGLVTCLFFFWIHYRVVLCSLYRVLSYVLCFNGFPADTIQPSESCTSHAWTKSQHSETLRCSTSPLACMHWMNRLTVSSSYPCVQYGNSSHKHQKLLQLPAFNLSLILPIRMYRFAPI